MPTPKIAVIIPFFQRETGILRRALASIAAQTFAADRLYVLLIDDGSPVAAEAELIQHPSPEGLRIVLIRQHNRGPNEARNTGLDNLEPGTDLVAFLDSDDEWIGDHLRRAVTALACGYTAYFANLFHLGDSVNEFEKAKRVRPAEHPAIGNDPTLRAYQGDMVHQIATANIIFMPSLVIDAAVLGAARFPMAHRHGGGDYLYWMNLIHHGARFAFSTEPEVRCGRGINMWYASGWGTDGLALRIVDEARFRRTVLLRHATAPQTVASLQTRIAQLQGSMLQDVVHRLRRRKKIDWNAVKVMFQENPPTLSTVRHVATALYSKATGRSKRT